MESFNKYLLQQEYKKLAKLGDRLAKADQLVNWEAFRPIIKDLYRNDSELGGRPNHDEVVMVKLLALQETRDVLGATRILTPALAKKVIELKPMNQLGFYAKWPITLWRSARNPLYLECEGLEWETPDR